MTRNGLVIKANPKFVSKIGYGRSRTDSLVTPRLLDMTSYDSNAGQWPASGTSEEEDFETDREMDLMAVRASNNGNNLAATASGRQKKMTFEDLGKVYTNISRKRILSKASNG